MAGALVFSRFEVNDKEYVSGLALDEEREIRLNPLENFFTIHFTFLNYSQPDSNRYQFILEGLDRRWRMTGQEQNFATYTSVPPGDYTFRVRATHPRGFYSEVERKLQIILPLPWYLTNWATAIWLFLAGLAGYGIYLYLRRRWQLQLQLQLQEQETLRQKDFNETLSRFYTNITHEFRTPLTVILGVAKEAIVQRNARRLLDLVNQILDLSKLESGKLKLNPVQGDVITFLKYITESFHSLAEQKDIELAFQSDTDELLMDYDPERLQEIVCNLLSNAIKFTAAGGEVQIFVENPESRVWSRESDGSEKNERYDSRLMTPN